jgi:hypothetical protein
VDDVGLVVHLNRGMQDPEGFHERMRADPVLCELLGYAHDHAVPPSVLAGRVYPNPVDPTEPLWMPEDRADVLAYRLWLRGLCVQCGIHERDWSSDREQPYIAAARLCHGCVERLDAEYEHRDHKHAGAIRLRFVPFDGDEGVG